MIKPIFKPRKIPTKDPMRIVALFSGGASAVPFMIGETHKVVGAISSNKNASGIDKLKKYNIPVIVDDIHDFYGDKSIEDMKIREEYDEKNLSIIEDESWEPDIIACSGYMYFLTSKLLDAFPNRVLNVHPADLSILENGNRKYVGDNAVKNSIENGEKITRSTIHLMDKEEDHGPILYISDGLAVEDRTPGEQQELMKQKCDGPAYRKTLDMLSKGLYGIDEENNIYLKKNNRFVLIYRDENGEYFWDNV